MTEKIFLTIYLFSSDPNNDIIEIFKFINKHSDKIIIDDARYQIVDKNLRELIETYQDNLEFSDDFEVLEDGTISLKEVNNG